MLAPGLLAILTLLVVTGCSGSGGDDSAGDGDSGGSVSAAEAPVAASDDSLSSNAQRGVVAARQSPVRLETQALIRRGNVELTSTDVGKARIEAIKVSDRYGGQVSDEETDTGDDGDPSYARLVLRIPSDHFDQAMDELSDVADLVSATATSDDVTTKLIDTQTRLAVQKRSIARISTLLDRAESIRDIMSIESQLSRRQADLESLERQVAYLTDQTTLSTITVSIDRTPDAKPAAAADDSGFVAGLKAGWGGLTAFAVGLATVAGALLPWLVVAAILAPPALVLGRRARRRLSARSSGRTPSAA